MQRCCVTMAPSCRTLDRTWCLQVYKWALLWASFLLYYFTSLLTLHATAEKMFRLAILADPSHIEALYNLGNLLWDVHRDVRGAREQFDAALAINANDLSTLCNMGQLTAIADENNLKGAEAYYQKALSVDSSHVPTLFEYACLRARMGDDSSAQVQRKLSNFLNKF